jgi:hypothetical protein
MCCRAVFSVALTARQAMLFETCSCYVLTVSSTPGCVAPCERAAELPSPVASTGVNLVALYHFHFPKTEAEGDHSQYP